MATKGERTRGRLVQAAGELFGTRGVDEVTVDQICLAAGVAKGTFYGHFRRREDVLLAAIAEFLAPLDRYVDAWIESALPIVQAMDRLVDFLALLGIADRTIVSRAIAEAVARPEDFDRIAGRRMSRALQALFSRAQSRGEVREDMPAETLARISDSLLVASLLRWAQGEATGTLADELRASVRVLLEGCQAAQPSRRISRAIKPDRSAGSPFGST